MITLIMKLWMKSIGIKCGKGFGCKGFFLIIKKPTATVDIGDDFHVKSSPLSNLVGLYQRTIIVARRDGRIRIGNNVGISGATIHGSDITIGNNVAIGANTKILDHDFHSQDYLERRTDITINEKKKPILIGNDVFIGCNCLILKGTVIGDRSIVGAGSVVSGIFPSDCVIVGNPARVVRSINAQKKETDYE